MTSDNRSAMSLLIDGYNLLHASDVFPPHNVAPTLEQTRLALLDFLVEHLPAKQLPRTIVTFDAVGAPPGLPREMAHRGLAVQFAPRGRTADELLEELISAEPDPRNLLVVSSDHRVQRAARRRGAKSMDSGPYLQMVRSSQTRALSGDSELEKPTFGNPFPEDFAVELDPGMDFR